MRVSFRSGASLHAARAALAPVQPVSIPNSYALLAGGIAPRDHDDAAYGVMGPTGVAGVSGLCSFGSATRIRAQRVLFGCTLREQLR
jgi:hypothetical protein